MAKAKDPLRAQLASFLSWEEAHASFDKAVKGMPFRLQGVVPEGLPWSAWQLLEHLRLAQRDLLEFAAAPRYHAKRWPEEYWPKSPAPACRSSAALRSLSDQPVSTPAAKRTIHVVTCQMTGFFIATSVPFRRSSLIHFQAPRSLRTATSSPT